MAFSLDQLLIACVLDNRHARGAIAFHDHIIGHHGPIHGLTEVLLYLAGIENDGHTASPEAHLI